MRHSGHYWIKRRAKYPVDWEVAFYNISGWDLTGLPHKYQDSDFDEIDERQIVREKPKMSKEQITKAEELISDTIRKVDKLFGLL